MVTVAVFGDEPQPGDELSIDGKVVTSVRQMRVSAAVLWWRGS